MVLDLEFLKTEPEFYELYSLIDRRLKDKEQHLEKVENDSELAIYKDQHQSVLNRIRQGIEYYSKLKHLLNEIKLRDFKLVSDEQLKKNQQADFSKNTELLPSKSKVEANLLLINPISDKDDSTISSQPQPPPESIEKTTIIAISKSNSSSHPHEVPKPSQTQMTTPHGIGAREFPEESKQTSHVGRETQPVVSSSIEQSNQISVSGRTVYRVEPRQMLKPRYQEILAQKGKNTKDILSLLFSEHKEPLYTNQITKILYDAELEEDVKRCEASIAAQLRIGAKEGRWLKLGTSYFAPLDLQI